MRGDPCTVCGSTDLKLIDGYYYCVECDTQNTNARETVVEQKTLGDGTIGLATRKKIVTLQDSKIQMSAEWYKWYAYNSILLGLADELVAVGAQPTFKTKLLWIWIRYIKKYQDKEELAKTFQNENLPTSFMVEENSTSNPLPEDEGDRETTRKSKYNVISEGSRRDIRFLSKSVLLAMLYLALNLDDSDLQLSHLYRFLREKRLNLSNLHRFVPDEIDVKSIPMWINFVHSKLCNMHQVRALAMSLLRKLDLGTPRVPNLRKIVDNFLTELCLPNDMKPLIYSLMHFHRCDFLDINNRKKENLVRIPDYEAVVMSYVLVATKICFGLDSDYELRLSNAVEKINQDRGLTKAHRNGKYSEPSNRLFSFREWCSYIQFRKIMLCKCCLHMSEQYNLDIDDYVYMEHLEKRPNNDKDLQDETAIDLINKIPEENEGRVIPKELFIPTLTPMCEYTNIIIEHSQNPEMRNLLSEDFAQYSLKYACEYLDLVDINAENIIKGVSENKKTISKVILGSIVMKKSKSEMVYVKNCENRNWMKTNPPTMEHVTCDDPQNESNDKESDHGYDSEHTANEKAANSTTELNIINDTDENITKDKKQVIITEETEDKNIFDDLFLELELKDELEQNNLEDLEANNEEPQLHNNDFPNDNLGSDMSDSEILIGVPTFNPDTFDKDRTIKELVLDACKKYKIPIPPAYKTKEPRKRKTDMFGNEAGHGTPNKRPRTKRGESKKKVEELLSNYYNLQQFDFINQVRQEVNLAIRNTQLDVTNVTQNNMNNQTNTDSANEVLSDALERSSICIDNMDCQSNANLQNATLEPNLDITNKTDINNQTVDEIDENLESTLFEEDDEMKLHDLIPKGDPKFDEEKYDVRQLYIKIKLEEEDLYDLQEEPKLDEIISKKIEECKNSAKFAKLKPEPVVKPVKTTYESDSEDEIPLKVLQEEQAMIEQMITWEQSFDPLISKENISDFKYWFRHYDTDFMLRSVDLHKKFDEELKENTPSSFYFVIQKCASIINCSTFYLYKQMQLLEQFILSRAKNPD